MSNTIRFLGFILQAVPLDLQLIGFFSTSVHGFYHEYVEICNKNSLIFSRK